VVIYHTAAGVRRVVRLQCSASAKPRQAGTQSPQIVGAHDFIIAEPGILLKIVLA
jgi:hypothetical protein